MQNIGSCEKNNKSAKQYEQLIKFKGKFNKSNAISIHVKTVPEIVNYQILVNDLDINCTALLMIFHNVEPIKQFFSIYSINFTWKPSFHFILSKKSLSRLEIVHNRICPITRQITWLKSPFPIVCFKRDNNSQYLW